jgi:hypothetical protein
MLTTIIILILLAAGFYVWRKQKAAKAAKVQTVTAPSPATPAPPVAVPPANGGANDPKAQ